MNVLKPVATLLLALAALHTTAQTAEPPRCSTTEYMAQQIQNNPALLFDMKKAEGELQHWITENGGKPSRGVITIPVVVHLVYNPAVNMTLSDWQVKSQIDVLNEDYAKT